MQQHTWQAQSPVNATLPMSFNAIQCHSLSSLTSSLTVTILSCSLQRPGLERPLLDLSLSLSLSLPLPLDEPVLQKGLQQPGIHTQCTNTSSHHGGGNYNRSGCNPTPSYLSKLAGGGGS